MEERDIPDEGPRCCCCGEAVVHVLVSDGEVPEAGLLLGPVAVPVVLRRRLRRALRRRAAARYDLRLQVGVLLDLGRLSGSGAGRVGAS